jgi:hypothetical protein
MKSKLTAYLLCIFLGLWGIHRLYLGKTGTGLLYFFTLGLFGIGWLYDLITLSGQVDKINGTAPRKQTDFVRPVLQSDFPQSDHAISPSDEEIMFGDLVAETNTTLRINYETDDGILSERTVDVKRVLASSHNVYISGYCHLRNGTRTFRLDRISAMWIKGQKVSPQEFVDDVCQHSKKYQAMRREAFVNKKISGMSELGMEASLLVYVARLDGSLRKNERELITRYLLDNHDLKDIAPEELEERIAGSQFRISGGDFRGNAKLITITDNLLDCAYKIAGNDPMKKGAVDKLIQYQTRQNKGKGKSASDLANEALKD